jgi:hypothetical protein
MVTETLTVPYSHTTFHSTLDISKAGREFNDRKGKKFVNDTLAPIVKKHNLEEVFGVGLVHRHFDISPDEKLVEFNNISTPWTVDAGINNFNGRTNSLIYEVAWMLDSDGKWMAYEYSFSPVKGRDRFIVEINDPKYKEFLVDYTVAVKAGGWEKLLGLRAWPGKGFNGVLEFTQGKANINLVPGEFEFSQEDDIGYAETMWFWAPEFLNNEAICDCIYGTCSSSYQVFR